MEKVKRVLINNVDSYASKYIAKLLSEHVPSPVGDTEAEDKKHHMSQDSEAGGFHIIGTVCDKSEEDRSHVSEEHFQLQRDQLFQKLMDCDVIIYNITQHADQVEEASWAVSALHDEMGSFTGLKIFILVSTVMTWACSKPVDPDDLELPFTDDDFRRRKAHPNFIPHITLEKLVVKAGKTNRALLSTYVVASGLQYGMDEHVFHLFFKMAWLGQEVPVFGDGNNIVPMIHIIDLGRIILNLIENRPKPYYLLAVDKSHNTMEDIVKIISSFLGSGKIQKKPFEDAFLQQDLSVFEIDSMLINLRMEAAHVTELFSIQWQSEDGLVKNIEVVSEEYQQSRGLLSIRLCVLGPPAVGKSTMCRQICQHYKLHHISLHETISEAIKELEDTVKNTDSETENEESAGVSKLLNSLKESMEQNKGHLDEQLLVKVVQDKLLSNPCRKQGFVLDGFPRTYEEAKNLFYDQEHESADGPSKNPLHKIIPEFLLCMDASDAFLTDRVMNLPQKLVEEHNYHQEHFLQQLSIYRESKMRSDAVLNCFDELDIIPLCVEVTSDDKPDTLLLMQKVIDFVGKPRNYGPSSQEVEEEERREAEERRKCEAQKKAEEEQREAEEAMLRASQWEKWTAGLLVVQQQEEELLEVQSVPLRNYLMEHVMPTLTQGLAECCTIRPHDPVDFLAEYLIRNNPLNY
ncbi:adenylate kinase 7 [Thalassophryne amazonica]|uniref:adenylate kinase 7 n=1 Tax=Thalassophryne amazonica TaxID=390379 RepID=UPI00147136A7|nr:adenylate kinase 7 [Thalassophryne amazonica]